MDRLIPGVRDHLVVTGMHGRGQFKKMILGSVAEEVFGQADCPVLTVGPQAEAQVPRELGLENILLATDFLGPAPSGQRSAPSRWLRSTGRDSLSCTLLKTCVHTLRKRKSGYARSTFTK